MGGQSEVLVAKEILLPESPEYVSGESCPQGDKVDRFNPNYLVERFINLTRSEEFKQPGWKVAVRTYEMSKPSSDNSEETAGKQAEKTQEAGIGYNTLEIIEPDGSTFASLNALHIDRATGAIQDRNLSGGNIATFVDDCAAGNEIAIPENKKAETILLTGKGSDALLMFAKATECAKAVSTANFDYSSDKPDWYKYQVNQNTLTRAYAESATGSDKVVLGIMKNAKDAGIESPGLNIDLIEKASSRYNHESGDKFVTDPYAMSRFCDDLKVLNPTTLQATAIKNGIIEEIQEQMREQQSAPSAKDATISI